MAIDQKQISGTSGTLYTNVTCDQIRIAEDKLRLKLIRHLDKAKKSKDWVTWLSVFISTSTPLMTATFNDWLFLTAGQIESLFWIFSVGCLLMFIKSLFPAFSGTNVDKIVDDFKNEE